MPNLQQSEQSADPPSLQPCPQVNYVHTDCNEAMLQIRLAFRRGATELAPGKAVASVADITLPTDLDEAALLGGTMPALSLTISELRPLPLDTSLSVRQQVGPCRRSRRVFVLSRC